MAAPWLTSELTSSSDTETKKAPQGCWHGWLHGNLYRSLGNLSEALLITDRKKDELLEPLLKWEKASLLLQPPSLSATSTYEENFVQLRKQSPACDKSIRQTVSQCSRLQYFKVQLTDIVSESESGIVKKSIAYTVTDDLSVTPGSMILGIGLLQGNIRDTGTLKERVVDIGPDEVLELWNASMQTNEALTTVFLPREEKVFETLWAPNPSTLGMKII